MIATTSAARSSGVESCSGSSRTLPEMPRGSSVTTVWSSASASANGANAAASIGAPMTRSSGPVPRTS
jgi:pyruvoyl-dependent arginine decarboxylase (PvlArgDC)